MMLYLDSVSPFAESYSVAESGLTESRLTEMQYK